MNFACKPLPRYTRISQGYKSSHLGIDFAAPKGYTIVAVMSGTVARCGNGVEDWSYGNQVVINHGNGYYTNYAHMSKISVKKGQKVSAGQKIGEVGSTGNSTGNHCHFELRNKLSANHKYRLNPTSYVNNAGKTSTSSNASSSGYTIGRTYTLRANMNVRTGPGTGYARKSRSALTANARAHATSTGVLKSGTKVTCKGVYKSGNDIWLLIPSGYVCAKKSGKVYIS